MLHELQFLLNDLLLSLKHLTLLPNSNSTARSQLTCGIRSLANLLVGAQWAYVLEWFVISPVRDRLIDLGCKSFEDKLHGQVIC